MCQVLDADSLKGFLVAVLNPLHRTATRELATYPAADQSSAHECCVLAQEVLELVQKCVGAEAYLEMYSHVTQKVCHPSLSQTHRRGQVAANRRKRKRVRATTAVADPALHARRKQRKAEKGKARRKRKMEVSTSVFPFI